LLTTLSGQGKSIFTTQEAQEILGGPASATYKMLHDLVRGGWLHSLGKGRYLIIPLEAGPERQYTTHSFLIAHHLAPESYIAYWSALHHHGLTEQLPRPVWIATPRRRKEVTIAGVQYIFVTLRPHKVFGHEGVWIEGQGIPVADLEKSLVDGLDHPEHCGGIVEVAKSLDVALREREADLERLTEYARRMRNGAIFKRLGYLAEVLSLPVGALCETWRAELSAGYAKLDPSRPAAGSFNTHWRVHVNVREAELMGWRES
jgi:predicted transcriptional regulator of viral defense system